MDPGSPDARPGLFRPDEPAPSVRQDRFGHGDFVELLKYVICNGEAPLNIALYGKWGVGKSSILKFFRTEVSKDKSLHDRFVFVPIDVWKLSPRILKQEFLDALNQELGSLTDEEMNERLWHHREETSDRSASLRKKYALATAGGVGIFAVLAAASQSAYFENHSLLSSSFVASVIPVFVVMANELRSLSKRVTGSTKTIIPRIESYLQFRELFEDIVNTKSGKRPIITIDNLDRCDSESVVAILSMIKTFLDDPKCFFIVACDQDAIIKHLQVKKGLFDQRYAKEFLSKFFQVSLYIPDQIKGQLYEYAKSQLGAFESDIEFDPNVADIFANAGTRNSRKIRQFVYNFAIAYRMASIKENTGAIAKGTVTGNTPFLAKITVLREDWPDFFQKLEKSQALLGKIEEFVKGGSENKEHKEILENNEGLKHFLRATGTVKSVQILPFMQLGQESFETSLSKLDRLIVAMNQHDEESLKEIVQEDPERQHEYVLKLCGLAEEYVEDGRDVVASNAISVLVDLHDTVNDESRKKIIKLFDELMADSNMLKNLVVIDADAMFSITPSLDPDTRERIYLEYAESLSVTDSRFFILKKLIGKSPLLTPLVCDDMDRNLGSWAQNDQELFYDMTTLLMESDAPEKFIKNNILKGIIESSQSGKDKWTERYLELKHLADAGTKRAFVEKALSAVRTEEGEKMPPDHRKTYETLRKMSLGDFTADTAKHAYDVLKDPARHYADAGDKALAAGIILKIYAKLDPADREEFAADVFAPLLGQSGPQNLAPLAEVVRKEGIRILELEAAANAVFSLLRNAPSRESVDLMYAGVPESKWADVEEKIVQVHDADFGKVEVLASAFALSARAPEELRAKALGRMAQSCQRFSWVQQLSIHRKLSKALGSESGLMGAFADGLSFGLGSNDRAEIDAYLELAGECLGKAAETKRREMFSALFDKLQQYPTQKKDLSMLKFLMSNNKSMDRGEKTQLGKVAINILGANNNSLIMEVLDEFSNLDLGDNKEPAYELVRKLCESHDQDIKSKALEIVEGHGLH